MKKIVSMSGIGKLAPAGKRMISKAMYIRGRQFLHSALLLKDKTGNDYVFLHLLCQGLEITLKSALLEKNYDKYKPQLRKIGHNLEKALEAFQLEKNELIIDAKIVSELKDLNSFYQTHRLRYASMTDLFIDCNSIDSELSLNLIISLIQILDKKFKVVEK